MAAAGRGFDCTGEARSGGGWRRGRGWEWGARSNSLKMAWAGRCESKPPFPQRSASRAEHRVVAAGVGRAGTGACEPGSGCPPGAAGGARGRRKAGRGAGVCGTRDTGRPPRGRGVLRVYSGSGVEGRARAGGGAGRASCLGEGTRGGRSRGAGLESAALAAASPAGAAAPCSARPGTAGAMDRARGKRSRGARTCGRAGRGGRTAIREPARKTGRARGGG